MVSDKHVKFSEDFIGLASKISPLPINSFIYILKKKKTNLQSRCVKQVEH